MNKVYPYRNSGSSEQTFAINALVLLILMFFSSLATAQSSQTDVQTLVQELGYAKATTVKEINNYRIEGFNTVNDYSVVLNTGPQRHYLITLRNRCFGLKRADNLGFTSTLSKLTTFDNIVVSNGGAGRDECPIKSIYKLENKL